MGHIQHKAQAGMFVAALLAAVLALPGAAFGLSTDKATAKPNEDGGSGVIGGMNTRLTWEGTVDDGESVDAVTLELPEGATFDGSSTRITVLEGLNRVKIDGKAQPDGKKITVAFAEPIPAGSLLRLEVTDMQFPSEGGDYAVEGHALGGGQVLGDPVVAGGAGLAGDLLVGDVQGVLGLAGVLLDHDGLVGVEVGLGEVDLLLAVVGDGDAGDGHVGLAALLDQRHEGVELLVGQVGGLEAHLFGHGGDEVDVEADGLAGLLVHVLERGEAELGGDGQLAVLDEGVGVCLGGVGAGAGGAGAAAAGEGRAAGEGAEGQDEVATRDAGHGVLLSTKTIE